MVFSSDAELDQQLTGSEMLFSALLLNTLQGSESPDGLAVSLEGPYDFYQHSKMSEACLCLPVLEQLDVAVKKRLEDWPEHPVLIQVSIHFSRKKETSSTAHSHLTDLNSYTFWGKVMNILYNNYIKIIYNFVYIMRQLLKKPIELTLDVFKNQTV